MTPLRAAWYISNVIEPGVPALKYAWLIDIRAPIPSVQYWHGVLDIYVQILSRPKQYGYASFRPPCCTLIIHEMVHYRMARGHIYWQLYYDINCKTLVKHILIYATFFSVTVWSEKNRRYYISLWRNMAPLVNLTSCTGRKMLKISHTGVHPSSMCRSWLPRSVD